MSIQLNLASKPKQVLPDRREPDFYIDSNYCTLQDAVQHKALSLNQ